MIMIKIVRSFIVSVALIAAASLLFFAHPARADECDGPCECEEGCNVDPPPPPAVTGADSSGASIGGLANQRFNQMITNRVLGTVLLGVNEQVNCSDCVSAFGSAGSFSAGIHGRKELTNNLSLLAGLAYTQYSEGGYHVTSAPIGQRHSIRSMPRSQPAPIAPIWSRSADSGRICSARASRATSMAAMCILSRHIPASSPPSPAMAS